MVDILEIMDINSDQYSALVATATHSLSNSSMVSVEDIEDILRNVLPAYKGMIGG